MKKHITTGLIFLLFMTSLSYCSQSSQKNTKMHQMNPYIETALIKLKQNYNLSNDDYAIIVNPENQTLYLIRDDSIHRTFVISTGKNGLGSEANSGKTPTGSHRIKKKFGDGAETGAIFVARANTGKIAEIHTDNTDIEKDHVTTRILWLEGLEEGINKGKGIDSYHRYIYIHGTPEEGLLGQPASQGCIRMKNSEVIELFSTVPEGTLVEILDLTYKE